MELNRDTSVQAGFLFFKFVGTNVNKETMECVSSLQGAETRVDGGSAKVLLNPGTSCVCLIGKGHSAMTLCS